MGQNIFSNLCSSGVFLQCFFFFFEREILLKKKKRISHRPPATARNTRGLWTNLAFAFNFNHKLLTIDGLERPEDASTGLQVFPRSSQHNSPLWVAVQLGQHRVVAVLKHQVELPFAAEHLDQVNQVAVFELLGKQRERERKKNPHTIKADGKDQRGGSVRRLGPERRASCSALVGSYQTDGNKAAVLPDNMIPSSPIYELPPTPCLTPPTA